ncbi:hypothetical protein M422DRAFT_268464 [Sphaerobolus stellatus SS14]|uniref:Uncharacterized protein n=1 Tax=Sphaerobolus stellatus (strain SS14) TaxID=990650 RepID=A0A0C9UY31_SPHS4|nr:hypothetical protein M422DRAFT_268464 [Sphaerobolus stellatus SS14]
MSIFQAAFLTKESIPEKWNLKIDIPNALEGKVGEIAANFTPHIYPKSQEYA